MAPTLLEQGSMPDSGKPSAWGIIEPILHWIGNAGILLVAGYGISDMLIQRRQRKADEKIEVQKIIQTENRKITAQQKAWAKSRSRRS